MRTDHCNATRCAAVPWAANWSGCAWRCSAFQRASMALRCCANRRSRPKSSKSSDSRFMHTGSVGAAAQKNRQRAAHWRVDERLAPRRQDAPARLGAWPGHSNAKALATTTAVTLVGIVEFEAFIEALAHEVQFGAVDVSQALGIDQHLDAMVFEDDVFRRGVIDILQFVSQPRTPGGSDPQAHPQPFAASGKVAAYMPGRGFCQRDGHGAQSSHRGCGHALGLVVEHGGLDCVFGQYRAVDLV